MISDTIKISGRDREIISFVRPINVEENIMAIAIKDLFYIYTKSDFNTMLNKIKNMANFTNENNMNYGRKIWILLMKTDMLHSLIY